MSDGDGSTHPGEADFVPEVVEATDAVLGILVVVVFDEAEAREESVRSWSSSDMDIPFAHIAVEVDDGLRALDVTEAAAPGLEYLITGLRQQSTDVDIGLASLILQSTVERLQG